MQVGCEEGVEPGPCAQRLRLDAERYARLVRYVDGFLRRDAVGRVTRVADGYTPRAAFFAAGGSYSLLFTCNTWVADGLRMVGAPTPAWAGTAWAPLWHLPASAAGLALSAR